MAISLKKHTPGAGEQESARLNDVNQNWGTIEQAINDLQANASLIDFSSSLTSIDGVENLRAYKAGHVHYLTFTYKPTQTGFITSVISGMSTAYRPGVTIAGSVGTSTSSADGDKGIAAYMAGSGAVGITVGTLPGYEMRFTFTWIV